MKAIDLSSDDHGKKITAFDGTRLVASGTYLDRPHPTRRPHSAALAVGYISSRGQALLLLATDTIRIED